MTHLLRGLLAVLLFALAASPAFAAEGAVNAGVSALLLTLLGLAGLGATVEGGVFGVYRNKIGGVVFSTWRGIQTARQRVTPSNPQSIAQTEVRTVFAWVVQILKSFGSELYRADWNNALGTLPGFQSLMSILLENADYDAEKLGVPAQVSLGDLPTVTASIENTGDPGDLTVAPPISLPSPLTAADEFVVIVYPRLLEAVDSFIPTPERVAANASANFTGLKVGEDYVVGYYIVGKGDNEGQLSPAKFVNFTAN